MQGDKNRDERQLFGRRCQIARSKSDKVHETRFEKRAPVSVYVDNMIWKGSAFMLEKRAPVSV